MRLRLLLFPSVAALLLLPSCGKATAPATQTSAPAQVATVTSLAALDSKPHPIGYIDPQNPYPTPDRSAPGGCTLTGTVLDTDGKPVSGARVTLANEYLMPAYNYTLPPDVVRDARSGDLSVTNAEGHFLFNFLYPGQTDVRATTPTSFGWTRQLDSNARDVTVRLSPKTESLTFEGTLFDTDGKSPVPDARILLIAHDIYSDDYPVAETRTDSVGRYHLQRKPDPSIDLLWLIARPENRAIAWYNLPNGIAPHIDLQLKPQASFTGRVLNQKGEPISGAKVSFAPSPNDPQYGFLRSYGRGESGPYAMTDRDGRYEVAGIPQGATIIGLIVRHPEYQTNSRLRVVAATDAQQEAPDILLAERAFIEGTVYLSGKPASNAAVDNLYKPGTANYASATTDENGHYRLPVTSPQSQQRIAAQLGGTPPQWEAFASTERPMLAGEHVTLDMTLKPSLASLEAQWKLVAGTPRTSRYNIAIVDDCDVPNRGKTTYDDTVSVRNSAGELLWQKKGLNVYTSTCAHTIAADPQRKTIWVCEEEAGNRLLQYSYSGDLIFDKPDVKPFGVALDPKTGNAWVVTYAGQMPGDKLVVFSPKGEKLREWDIKGMDIAYSAHDDCFWIAGKELWKLDRDGNVSPNIQVQFDSYADGIAVNENDGSLWISEKQYSAFSTSAQVHLEANGTLRKNLETYASCMAVDAQRKVAWISGTKTCKTDLDGNVLTEVPLNSNCCVIEPDTGYIWVYSWKSGTYRLDPDGKPVWHDPSVTHKTFCLVLQ